MKPTVRSETQLPISRRDQIVVMRLRLGHSNLIHQHLLQKKDPPICEECNEQLTVKHVPTDCKTYKQAKQQYKLSTNLQLLLVDKTFVNVFKKYKPVPKNVECKAICVTLQLSSYETPCTGIFNIIINLSKYTF